ncbi:MAG: fumarate reductase [Deltaproteobacteria bacterium RIFOXYB12_FULL_58_9]|nr:MAG: fumarate reductase [Deltaproteobacteria bacterium RIFOXYB12_FULL_58_9]
MESIRSDILILGMGGAAELAALAAYDANPKLRILMVTKALRGKGGCSRMVQGGFNVVLDPEDSHEKHLMDTLKGGQFINNQDLAKTLVEQATPTIKEMETKYGCFFDRNPNGTVHQKPFAGQSFDRTVHKGDLTGIEIISRTTEQVAKRQIPVLEEHRALDLLTDASGKRVTGALLLDIRRGQFVVAQAKATLVATGGGPTNYRFFAPGPEKSLDGLAMLSRVGASMLDMEMVQFHPTGLIIPGSVVAGSLLEEGLRGAGAYLLNAEGERYMQRYDPKAERATRDVVSRSSYLEMMAGRGFEHGGVHIVASHLGADTVEKNFPGMCARCRTFGYDLARKPVPVSPTAHFVMGGAEIDTQCHTTLEGLFCAGEDAGGVHGANRLGGNGICDSCVFGRIAGKAMAEYVVSDGVSLDETPEPQIRSLVNEHAGAFNRPTDKSVFELRDHLRETNWAKVGIVRNGPDLKEGQSEIEAVGEEVSRIGINGGRPYNMAWTELLNLRNMVDVSRLTAGSAALREEKRGAHYREDHPEQNDDYGLFNTFVRRLPDGTLEFEKRPVDLKYATFDGIRK